MLFLLGGCLANQASDEEKARLSNFYKKQAALLLGACEAFVFEGKLPKEKLVSNGYIEDVNDFGKFTFFYLPTKSRGILGAKKWFTFIPSHDRFPGECYYTNSTFPIDYIFTKQEAFDYHAAVLTSLGYEPTGGGGFNYFQKKTPNDHRTLQLKILLRSRTKDGVTTHSVRVSLSKFGNEHGSYRIEPVSQ